MFKLLKNKTTFVVKAVSPSTLKDYAGMNHWAAKHLGFHPLPAKNVVLVDKKIKGSWKTQTIRHEIIEANLMKQGWSYWHAHQMALKHEKEPYITLRKKNLRFNK